MVRVSRTTLARAAEGAVSCTSFRYLGVGKGAKVSRGRRVSIQPANRLTINIPKAATVTLNKQCINTSCQAGSTLTKLSPVWTPATHGAKAMAPSVRNIKFPNGATRLALLDLRDKYTGIPALPILTPRISNKPDSTSITPAPARPAKSSTMTRLECNKKVSKAANKMANQGSAIRLCSMSLKSSEPCRGIACWRNKPNANSIKPKPISASPMPCWRLSLARNSINTPIATNKGLRALRSKDSMRATKVVPTSAPNNKANPASPCTPRDAASRADAVLLWRIRVRNTPRPKADQTPAKRSRIKYVRRPPKDRFIPCCTRFKPHISRATPPAKPISSWVMLVSDTGSICAS